MLGKCFIYDIFTLPEAAEGTAEMKDSERKQCTQHPVLCSLVMEAGM